MTILEDKMENVYIYDITVTAAGISTNH